MIIFLCRIKLFAI